MDQIDELEGFAHIAAIVRPHLEEVANQMADKFGPNFEVGVVLGFKGKESSLPTVIVMTTDRKLFAEGLHRWATKALAEIAAVGEDGG